MATSEAIVDAWERGLFEHPLDRALTLLEAFAGVPRQHAAGYPIGRRDALLVGARAALYGRNFEGYATCRACGAGMECSFPLPELDASDEERTFTLALGTRSIELRLPDSRDLAAIVACRSVDEAAAVLLERCTAGAVGFDEETAGAIDRAIAERCEAAAIE